MHKGKKEREIQNKNQTLHYRNQTGGYQREEGEVAEMREGD